MSAINDPQFQIRIQFDQNRGEWKWEIFSEQKPGRYVHTLYKGYEYTYTGATTKSASAVLELINIEAGVSKLVETAKVKALERGHNWPLGSSQS